VTFAIFVAIVDQAVPTTFGSVLTRSALTASQTRPTPAIPKQCLEILWCALICRQENRLETVRIDVAQFDRVAAPRS